jgi:multidrug efflux system membrane fusion protein
MPVLVYLLFMAILLAGVALFRELAPPFRGQAAPVVTVVIAAEAKAPILLKSTGHVTTPANANVTSGVNGVLEKVYFQEGDEVEKGRLMFSIDPRLYQSALNLAMASLERDQAMAHWEDIKVRSNIELPHQGILGNTFTPNGANANGLAVAALADQAAVDNARLQRACCDIYAPINGRTGMVKVNAGDWVKKQDTVLVIVNQTKPIYVDFSVPFQSLSRIRHYLAAAGKLSVTASVLGNEPNPPTGELTDTTFAADAEPGSLFLRAIFPNTDEALMPGEQVNITLTLTTQINEVILPSQSVQNGGRDQYVFVVKPDSTVEVRPVQVVYQVGSETILSKGVKFGEQVVVSGQNRITPGMKVQIQNPNSADGTINRGMLE